MPSRRLVLAGAGAAVAVTAAAGAWSPSMTDKMPVIYVPHGGGPWPWMNESFFGASAYDSLRTYLAGLPAIGPVPPRAILMVSAHWEARVPTVSTAAAPPMLYDYSGFPPETYEIRWPAPGEPALAARVRSLLGDAGFTTAEDGERGFDHGTFVPLGVAWPNADVPTVQLSLVAGLDPHTHLRIGRALAPLRSEGVLIVGSGMSYHNMRGFGTPAGAQASEAFDAWLQQTVQAEPVAREVALTRWAEAPAGRAAHPREEHLLPLMVVAGAAGHDAAAIPYSDRVLGTRVSAVQFG